MSRPTALTWFFVAAKRRLAVISDSIESVVRSVLSVRVANGKELPARTVRQLEDRLWHGFSRVACKELNHLTAESFPIKCRVEATKALIRRHASMGAYEEVLRLLCKDHRVLEVVAGSKSGQMIRMYALLRLGEYAQALVASEAAASTFPDDLDTALAVASMRVAHARAMGKHNDVATAAYLTVVNNAMRKHGLTELTLRDEAAGPAFGNFAASANIAGPVGEPAKVSVIVPAFNAASTIQRVLQGLLQQTWRNLEIVVVDDASTDDSWGIVCRIAKQDQRIVPMRRDRNGGAYRARNMGLMNTTGEFVTVNDTDDWPHPQRIEMQAKALMSSPGTVANTCSLIRVDEGMIVQPRFDGHNVPIVHKSYPSLMLRRDLAMAMEGWDEVRFGADSELMDWITTLHGPSAIGAVLPGIPLSFSLQTGSNLTSRSSRGMNTLRFGARREYVRQFKAWHKAIPRRGVRNRSQVFPFPVPAPCVYGDGHISEYSTIVLSDFVSTESLQIYAESARRLAILCWPNYEDQYESAMCDDVVKLCREREIVSLVHGDVVNCDCLIIDSPEVMLNELDLLPDIRCRRVLIVRNGASAKMARKLRRVCKRHFGSAGQWVTRSCAESQCK